MSDIEYSIWCEKLQENISFNSIINDENIEMFDVTTIASYFEYSNKNIVEWFNNHIDILHLIDSVITGDEIDDNTELLSISENTIIKIDDNWFVNMNVLVEYLRTINMQIMHEILAQVMFDKVANDIEDDEDNSDDYEDNSDEYENNSDEYDNEEFSE